MIAPITGAPVCTFQNKISHIHIASYSQKDYCLRTFGPLTEETHMIKSLILIGLSFTASIAAAVDGDNLIPSLEESISLHGSTDSIVSWETKISADGVEVKLLTEEGMVESFACSTNFSLPSFKEMEFTMPLP